MPQFDALQALRDLYNSAARSKDTDSWFPPKDIEGDFGQSLWSEGYPRVRPAPPFRKPAPIIGDEKFVNEVERVFQAIPEARGRASKISQAPTSGVFRRMHHSGFQPDDFADTNLAGLHDRSNSEIWVHPREGFETLGHELGHAVNIMDYNPESKRGDERMPAFEGLLKQVNKPSQDTLTGNLTFHEELEDIKQRLLRRLGRGEPK